MALNNAHHFRLPFLLTMFASWSASIFSSKVYAHDIATETAVLLIGCVNVLTGGVALSARYAHWAQSIVLHPSTSLEEIKSTLALVGTISIWLGIYAFGHL